MHDKSTYRYIDRSQVLGSIDAVLPMPEANTTQTGPVTTKASTCTKETHDRGKHDHEFQQKNMSSSGKIRVPAEEYVIYFPPTDQSDSRITLNCSIRCHNGYCNECFRGTFAGPGCDFHGGGVLGRNMCRIAAWLASYTTFF